MSPAEYALLAAACALLAGNGAALAMWHRARSQRDDAIDAVDALMVNAERTINRLGDDLEATTSERDAAIKRSALAESRERITHAAWGRAVDKLLTPAPLTAGSDLAGLPTGTYVVKSGERPSTPVGVYQALPVRLQAVPRG